LAGSESQSPTTRSITSTIAVAKCKLIIRLRGKKNHLECKPVLARLLMTVHCNIESREAEAAKVKADPSTVMIEEDCITIIVGSLNQAYTKASLRLEPERQSHGGRTYDALFWIDPKGNKVSLGSIRDCVESDNWNFPEISLTDEK
jgi:hypothetical protein